MSGWKIAGRTDKTVRGSLIKKQRERTVEDRRGSLETTEITPCTDSPESFRRTEKPRPREGSGSGGAFKSKNKVGRRKPKLVPFTVE